MSVFSKQEAKILALKLIPIIINKIEIDSKKIRDLPEILEVDHVLGLIQFVYKVLDLEDEASDLLKKPSKIKLNIKNRYKQYLRAALSELKLEATQIDEIMAKIT